MGEANYPNHLSGTVKKTFSVAALTVLTGLLLSGCAGAPSPTPSDIPGPNPAATKPAVSTPRPDAAQQTKLIAELRKIDPALETSRTVDNARQQCRVILRGEPEATQITFAKRIFRNANMSPGSSSDDTAQKIIAVIKSNGFCKAAS